MIVWAAGIVGAAYVVKLARREWRRVNEELDRVKTQSVREPDRATLDRKSTRLNSSHVALSRMPSSA